MAAVAGDIQRAGSRPPRADERRGSVITLTHVWFAFVATILVAGWFLPLDRYLSPREGVGYLLGIVGGSMMLLLLIYPLRKRVQSLRFIGDSRLWFQVHMALGLLGPLCILYHCLYRLGATNSNVALVCMLVVSGSGVIGRYLYARIHHGLYGRQATLAEFREEAERLRSEASGASKLLPELAQRLEQSERRIGADVPLLPKALTASVSYRLERMRLRAYVRSRLQAAGQASPLIGEHEAQLGAAARRYVDNRLSAARRVAEFEACAKLFGLWHVLHIPLFFMLLFAGIVHVIAVHVY
jgi:hypothetical protein